MDDYDLVETVAAQWLRANNGSVALRRSAYKHALDQVLGPSDLANNNVTLELYVAYGNLSPLTKDQAHARLSGDF